MRTKEVDLALERRRLIPARHEPILDRLLKIGHDEVRVGDDGIDHVLAIHGLEMPSI